MLDATLGDWFTNQVAAAAAGNQDEDRELLTIAAKLGRDFAKPCPAIYWTDLVCTALVAYVALATTLTTSFKLVSLLAFGVAILAFYRGLSFIHELTHLRRDAVPGFRQAWNVLFGIPLLVPSFLYDDVHTVHHAKTTYGTSKDPEYLPFASLPHKAAVGFLAAGVLIPIGLLVRFAVLAPLSLAAPGIRRVIVERYSSLAINHAFRRRWPEQSAQPEWWALEAACSIWSAAIIGLTAAGLFGLAAGAKCFAVAVGVTLINQVRTLVSHAWTNHSDCPLSLTAQYLDSVNVPPPAKLPALWAPVGLRFHALHHLLPSVPYHALGQVHRTLSEHLGNATRLQPPDYAGMAEVWRRCSSDRNKRSTARPLPTD